MLTVDFTVLSTSFVGINGGAQFPITEAASFSVDCAHQAGVDRYWDALTASGGRPLQCCWLKDTFGLPWQIAPTLRHRLLDDPDRERAAVVMLAMLGMVKLDVAALQAAYDGR